MATTGDGRRGRSLTLVRTGNVAGQAGDGRGNDDVDIWDIQGEEGRARRREAAATFQRGVDAGTFHDLLAAPVRATITGAARAPGLEDEIGMLRLVMVRLLVEEDDLAKLVGGMARLSTAITQATRLRRAIGAEATSDLLDTLTRVLNDLDDEPGNDPGFAPPA